MKPSVSHLYQACCILLACLFALSGCASQVIIAKPYHEKLRIGDGIKITSKDGTIHSGRIVYLDRATVVIRTPKQKTSERPVEVARFGTTVPWSEVVRVRVAGTLDSKNKLISNEEIRVNKRTNHRRNLGVNVGLLGAGLSFLVAAYLQDKVSPPTTNVQNFKHSQGRTTFWGTFLIGSAASVWGGYRLGSQWDRSSSISRIERQRENLRQAAKAAAKAAAAEADSLKKAEHLPGGTSPRKF